MTKGTKDSEGVFQIWRVDNLESRFTFIPTSKGQGLYYIKNLYEEAHRKPGYLFKFDSLAKTDVKRYITEIRDLELGTQREFEKCQGLSTMMAYSSTPNSVGKHRVTLIQRASNNGGVNGCTLNL